MVATTFAADTPLLVTGLVATKGVAGNWLWWNFVMSGMLTVFFFARLWRRANVMTDVEFSEIRYSGRPAAFLRGFRAIYLAVPINLIIIGWVTRAMIKILTISLGVDADRRGRHLLRRDGVLRGRGGIVGGAVDRSRAVRHQDDRRDRPRGVLPCARSAASTSCAPSSRRISDRDGRALGAAGLGRRPARHHRLRLDAAPRARASFLFVQWWAAWYPGAEPGGGGYVAQRIFAARSERDGVLATLFFQIAHYALRPWPWIVTGLATVILYPTLQDKESGYVHAFVDLLPTPWRGFMLAGFAAAYMSTIGTQLNWGASYLVNDFYKRFLRPRRDRSSTTSRSRAPRPCSSFSARSSWRGGSRPSSRPGSS